MLKIGVFGAGHLGKIHIQQWKEIPGVELVGFCELLSKCIRVAFTVKGFPMNAMKMLKTLAVC